MKRRIILNLADGSQEHYDIDPEVDFAIDERNLESEITGIAQLNTLYGHIVSCLEAEFDHYKEYVQNLRAKVMRDAKNAPTPPGKVKLTDETCKAALLDDEEYQTALLMLRDLQLRMREAQRWYRGVNYKFEMVRSLNSRQMQEMKAYN